MVGSWFRAVELCSTGCRLIGPIDGDLLFAIGDNSLLPSSFDGTHASEREMPLFALKNCAKRKRKSYRMVCSNVQPEESGNKDYDDHDADDVKNVHCTLRLRHARLQGESTMLQ